MSTEIDKTLRDHLESKWGHAVCPMCRATAWQIVSTVYAPPQFSRGGVVVGGEAIPVVPVVCMNCGFTAWINAILSGVLEREEKKQ